MKKIILWIVLLSSSVFSYNISYSWNEGNKRMHKVSCDNGDWGFVTDYRSGSLRYWSSTPNQGYTTFDAAARSLCGE